MIDTRSVSFEEEKSRAWKLKEARDILERIIGDSPKEESLEKLLDPEKLVICSYSLGKILSSFRVGLKTAQVRRFYEAILGLNTAMKSWSRDKKTKAENEFEYFQKTIKPQVMMLKPQLANAQARQSREFTPLFTVLNPCINRVNSTRDLARLAQFMESIVAYHKFHGGRD